MKHRSLSRVSSLVRNYYIVPNSYFVRALTDYLFQAFLHRFYRTAWWLQLRSGTFLRIGTHFYELVVPSTPSTHFLNISRFMTPMMLGVCAIFFWVATKVHTNNALFIYCQRCEGGGKIFYYWNRIVFVTIYSSIVIFTSFLALKAFPKLGIAFLVTMLILTYCVDKSVETTFAIHSLHLPISMARIHDEEEVSVWFWLMHLVSSHYLLSCFDIYFRSAFLTSRIWNQTVARISCIAIQYWNMRIGASSRLGLETLKVLGLKWLVRWYSLTNEARIVVDAANVERRKRTICEWNNCMLITVGLCWHKLLLASSYLQTHPPISNTQERDVILVHSLLRNTISVSGDEINYRLHQHLTSE